MIACGNGYLIPSSSDSLSNSLDVIETTTTRVDIFNLLHKVWFFDMGMPNHRVVSLVQR